MLGGGRKNPNAPPRTVAALNSFNMVPGSARTAAVAEDNTDATAAAAEGGMGRPASAFSAAAPVAAAGAGGGGGASGCSSLPLTPSRCSSRRACSHAKYSIMAAESLREAHLG